MAVAAVLVAGLVAAPAAAQSLPDPSAEQHILKPGEMAHGDVAKGRKLTRLHCARCHVIKDFNPYGGVGNAPSLDRLVTWDDGIWRVATFFDRPPHAAFVRVEGVAPPTNLPPAIHPFELTVAELEDIVAFSRALKDKVESR